MGQNKKTAFDVSKLSLSAKPVNGSSRPPTLSWDFYQNNFAIKVFSNIESEPSRGFLRAGLGTIELEVWLLLLEDVINSKEPTRHEMENYNKENQVISKCILGKDKDGTIFIGLKAKGHTPIKFTFGYNRFHKLITADGSEATAAFASEIYAKAYLRSIRGLKPVVATVNYVHPDDIDRSNWSNNKNGKGNWNNKSQNKPKKQSNEGFDDFDDDIPF